MKKSRECYLLFEYFAARTGATLKIVCYIAGLALFAPSNVTTQTPTDPHRPGNAQKIPRVEVYWHSITYKTIGSYALLLLIIASAIFYLASPDWFSKAMARISKAVTPNDVESAASDKRQVKFVNLDGKVQIKKVNSVQWVDADYRTTLDKGDLVQTGSDGAARITFADGTFYTVKSETLVTIEENSTESDRPTNIAVRINTGQVNLATANWSAAGSKAAVSVEDTVAQLGPNSGAAVKADPQTKANEFTLTSGSAQVQRGTEKVELAPWQKITVQNGGPMERTDVLAPPDLAEPLNLTPIIVENPKASTVRFAWKPVNNAVSYTLRISATSMFTKTVKEVRVAGTSTEVTGLDAGDYFWNVFATDGQKKNSEVSEKFKFTLVAQGKTQEMALQVDAPQIHGRIVEVSGRTEPGAALIINGQAVPAVGADGIFRYFTEPLDPGQHTIVIIGQNRRGGTAKQQLTIVVPK